MSTHFPENNIAPRSRTLKWGLGICTTIYILLFPFLFYMAILSSMASDGPSTTPLMVGIIMSLMFLLPLSVPVSIYLMWSRYNRRQLDKALFFAGLPFYTLGLIFLIGGLLDMILRGRYPW